MATHETSTLLLPFIVFQFAFCPETEGDWDGKEKMKENTETETSHACFFNALCF